MRYVQLDSSRAITKYFYDKPAVFLESGEQADDMWLIKNDNVYPLIEQTYSDQEHREKTEADWVYADDSVTVTYWKIQDKFPADINEMFQKYVLKEEKEWEVTDEFIYKTYDVVDKSQEEVDFFIDSRVEIAPTKDSTKFFLRPRNEWVYENGSVHKTYYGIVDDGDNTPIDDINIYLIKQNDSSKWEVDGSNIHITYEKTPMNIDDLKPLYKNSITALRQKIEAGGAEITVDDSIVKFQSDKDTQTKIAALYIQANSKKLTNDVDWKTIDGFITLTSKNIESVYLQLTDFVEKLYTNEKSLIQSGEKATSVTDIISIYKSLPGAFGVTNSIFLSSVDGDMWKNMI